jgi:hypothetical protein
MALPSSRPLPRGRASPGGPALAAVVLAASAACGASAVSLHAPSIAATLARSGAARIDLEPITTQPSVAASVADRGGFGAGDPAAVLTTGMKAELGGRALRGGDPDGYVVRCALERFALRTQSNVAGTRAYAALYVDLTCEAHGGAERARVWGGRLRARDAATGGGTFGREPATMQRLVDRLVSDAARELASDLAIRALGLSGEPSARVFTDEAERADLASIDDAPGGVAALSESADAATSAAKARRTGPVLRAVRARRGHPGALLPVQGARTDGLDGGPRSAPRGRGEGGRVAARGPRA